MKNFDIHNDYVDQLKNTTKEEVEELLLKAIRSLGCPYSTGGCVVPAYNCTICKLNYVNSK